MATVKKIFYADETIEIAMYGCNANEGSPSWTQTQMNAAIDTAFGNLPDNEEYTEYAGGVCNEELHNEFGASNGPLISTLWWKMRYLWPAMPYIRIFARSLAGL